MKFMFGSVFGFFIISVCRGYTVVWYTDRYADVWCKIINVMKEKSEIMLKVIL
jgi:hypothetical protein